MTINTSVLSTWVANLAVVVGSGFVVFGDPSLGILAKAIIGGLAPIAVAVLTYSTHQTEQAKIAASATSGNATTGATSTNTKAS